MELKIYKEKSTDKERKFLCNDTCPKADCNSKNLEPMSNIAINNVLEALIYVKLSHENAPPQTCVFEYLASS